jgi:type IV pilus assembly protein PilV
MKMNLSLQKGVLMVEVLVAIVILSFGMLGLVGLQAAITASSINSEDRTQASMLADEIVTTMWLNKTVTLPAADITTWQTRVLASRLKATGSVSVFAGVATVTLVWKAPTKKATDYSNTYTTQVAL